MRNGKGRVLTHRVRQQNPKMSEGGGYIDILYKTHRKSEAPPPEVAMKKMKLDLEALVDQRS